VTWDPVLFRERNTAYANVVAAVFTGHGDGPACYVADALRAGVPVLTCESRVSREWSHERFASIDFCDDDALAFARRMKTREESAKDRRRDIEPPANEVDENMRLAARYWEAACEAL
jgi:hypothetical protein